MKQALLEALTFGRYSAECYYCGDTVQSRNLLLTRFKIGFHLSWVHGKDPDDLPESEVETVVGAMKIENGGDGS